MLLGLTDSIRSNMGGSRFCVLLSLDLEKAFDRVDYGLLLSKLKSVYKFSTSACTLLCSYLTGRSQFVCVDGKCSSVLSVRSGVPQGSVLGPLLFVLFVNDVFSRLDCWCTPFAYADDIQLLFKGDNRFLNVFQTKINFAMESLREWMAENRFSVNASKTKALFYLRAVTIMLVLDIIM